ncbi:MAG: CoA transferase [Gammaproteobacteria bacterium]|nr:CoA transferase [Gammaproteobacteria bacterium]
MGLSATTPSGVLEGVRVIDFGQYIAGPMAAMLLGDQGADVIRVDPPGGPRWDTPANATWNRNKRSIVLDLKQPDDVDRARRLIESADVVIENFRPGVMDRLGLGALGMSAANPRLIYCSMPGFAADDPRAEVAAWEGVIGAATATYRAHERTGRPVYTAIPVSSVYGAFQAAVSVGIALNVRERDGVGQQIEVPLFDGTFAAMGYRVSRIHNAPAMDPAMLRRMGGLGGQLECKDGRWVMYMGGNLRARDFLEATGAAEWVDAAAEGKMTIEEVQARTQALFKTRTAKEWEDFSEEVATECGVCRTSAEWLENEHALGSEIIIDVADPKLGTVRGPGINVRMSETPGCVRFPRRLPDADRKEILTELDALPTDALPTQGVSENLDATLRAALDGVKVLDLCIVLAGPTCGRTLAEFGADVIKIDSPSRRIGRFNIDVNRAKRSILLDLKTEEGLKVLWRLIDDADVIVQNFRNGVAERLGFGYEAVHARRPDIVYASLNYAGQVGPYAGRPGHEQIAQAVSGMQERFGGDGKPALQPYAINDYGTGLMGAYAVALALLHRQRTGVGQHVDTALAYTATMLQSSLIQDYQGKVWDEPRGQHVVGSSALHRAYEASDGWFFLGARASDLQRFPEIAQFSDLGNGALETQLESLFATKTVEEWIAALTDAGMGAQRLVFDPSELAQDPWVLERGLCVTREHADLGPVTTNAPGVRLSRTPAEPGRPAPQPGSDFASILADAGLEGEVERLLKDGVVAESLEGESA